MAEFQTVRRATIRTRQVFGWWMVWIEPTHSLFGRYLPGCYATEITAKIASGLPPHKLQALAARFSANGEPIPMEAVLEADGL